MGSCQPLTAGSETVQVGEDADVFEEVDQAGNEAVVAEIRDWHPGGFDGVVSGSDGSVGVEDGDAKVEDHEVRVVVEAFDPAEELVDDDVEAGLFGDFADDGRFDGFAGGDPPAGYGPLPCCWSVAAADEEELVVVHGDAADGELGSVHRSVGLSGRCMVRARAVKP